MRLLIFVMLALCLALPASTGVASAQGKPFRGNYENGQCKKIRKQLAHFNEVKHEARRRGNGMWEMATMQHMNRLDDRLERLCPGQGLGARLTEIYAQSKEIVKEAAKTAVKYFTMGMY